MKTKRTTFHIDMNISPPSAWGSVIDQQSTWCLPSCGSTSWPARSSPSAHTLRSGGGNAPWPPPHPVPPGAPPAGSACPLQRSALGCPSAAWGKREWSAGESASAGRGTLWCKSPSMSRWDRRETERRTGRKHKEMRTKDNRKYLQHIYTMHIHVHSGLTCPFT